MFQQLKGGDKAKLSNAEKMFAKLQKIDIETGLGIQIIDLFEIEPLEHNPVYFAAPDPAISDMLKLAEGKIDSLQQTKKDLEARIYDMENEAFFL